MADDLPRVIWRSNTLRVVYRPPRASGAFRDGGGVSAEYMIHDAMGDPAWAEPESAAERVGIMAHALMDMAGTGGEEGGEDGPGK